MAKLGNQKRLIHGTDWNVLIILDACRYDYFQEIYEDYLAGDLKKVKSPDCGTLEWLKAVFEGKKFDDTVYVSGNPYINSEGMKIPHVTRKQGIEKINGFDGSQHFHEVIKVWDWGWKDGSVKPLEIVEGYKRAKAKYPEKKYILHFMQPHGPYINEAGGDTGGGSRTFDGRGGGGDSSSLKKSVVNLIEKHIGEEFLIRLAGFLDKDLNSMMGTFINEGRSGLVQKYRKNLEIALKTVSDLVDNLAGKIIVTADHGEFLAEDYELLSKNQREIFDAARSVDENVGIAQFENQNQRFVLGHPYKVDHPILREVPWLEVVN